MKFFRYLFYRTYSDDLKWHGKRRGPADTAMLVLSVYMFFNLLTAAIVVRIIFTELPGVWDSLEFAGMLCSGVLLPVINYFIFIKDKKYEVFVKEFSTETKKQRLRGTIFIRSYEVLTFVMPVIVSMLRGELS